jgi:hypothetical protein
MLQKNKKIRAIIIITFMIFFQSLTNWLYFDGETAYASDPVEENKLVAIFVDKDIYSDIKNNLEWYSLQYVQARFPRTKVLVFPIDIKTIQANDIQKIISNLYFGWEKDTTSTLIGTVLVGNIPLPVIKKDAYIFPSIIPYTDIEKPAFIFDAVSSYFIPSSTSVDSRQDLFGSVINFDSTIKYNEYFEKIKKYIQNPKSFAEKKIWFEDFPSLQKTFTDQNLPIYLQWQIHEEDISYHRFSPGLFNLLEGSSNTDAANILKEAGNIPAIGNSTDYPNSQQSQAYEAALQSRGNNLASQASQWQASLNALGKWDQIPTLLMGKSIIEQSKTYQSLFSPEYWDILSKEISPSWRWTGVDISNHITKTALNDGLSSKVFFKTNDLLENTLDKKIKDNSWSLHIPIPVVREEYNCLLWIPGPLKVRQEAYYFGKNARDITNADQTSWYRGTYNNIWDGEKIKALPRGGNIMDTGDSMLRSVWATFGFTSQQVIASRWNNPLKAKTDSESFQYWKDQCPYNSNVSMETYLQYFRGGNSPLNIDTATMQLKYDSWQVAFNPSYDRRIGWALFDIGWGKLVNTGSSVGTNADAANVFGNFIPIAPLTQTPLPGGGMYLPRCKAKTPTSTTLYDFFSIAANPSNKDIQILSSGANSYNDSPTCKERLVYKTIDSIVKHSSPTESEISWMNITTKDRPIDAKRYITFRWLGWNIVSLNYPNVYNVEVYKYDWSILVLKSVSEIKQSIINYLQSKVQEYNTILAAENANIAGYAGVNSAGLWLLATKDPLASPVGRQYTQLPADFFVAALGDENIHRIADLLYVKNVAWETRFPQNTVWKTIDSQESTAHIEDKVSAILSRQLTVGSNSISVTTGWYEAAYIRSDGSDTFSTTSTNALPAIIQAADTKRNDSIANKTIAPALNMSQQQQQMTNDACGIAGDGTVPILKRPKALSCRWKWLKKLTAKGAINISYKNARWPVYPLWQLSNTLQESYKDYTDYVNKITDSDLVAQTEIKRLSLEMPYQKVIRGAQLPFNVVASNAGGDAIDTLLFPIKVKVDSGEILSLWQSSPELETTLLQEPLILDTTSIPPTVNRIRLSVHWPILPNGETWAVFDDAKDIMLVEGSLRVLVNNQNTTGVSFALPQDGYYTRTAGVSSVRDTELTTLSLRLTDADGQPLTSLASISSSNGLVQPWYISTEKVQTPIWGVNSKTFVPQTNRTISGWVATIYLMPTMQAWNDTITISIPWMPDRNISVNINASAPHSVSVVKDRDAQNGLDARFIVEDIWGNTVAQAPQINYTLIWDIKSNNQTQGVISWDAILPITYGSKWWVSYLYATLANSPNSLPWYLRIDQPSLLWPSTWLNVVYLTLEWKDRWNSKNTIIPSMISSSPKLLAVSTQLYDGQNMHASVGVISLQWTSLWWENMEISSWVNTAGLSIFIEWKNIGYIKGSAPYTIDDFVIQDPMYTVEQSWGGWSTNNIAFSIVSQATSTLDEEQIQDFSPLRSYAGWETVGEAQKHIFDVSRINYGDPFLQHADATSPIPAVQTTLTLFQDNTKIIKKVMELDIDNDGKKDMVILYDDDTIRFMKQYWWTPPYTQLGWLMAIADGVQDMRIGDADGDRLQDIFIKTKKNTLRMYKNQAWSFDVNGIPVCIDVPSWDTSLSNVRDLYIEDMNNDGITDIISNDSRGQVRIFYWGNEWWQWFYTSSNPNGCDAWWQQRQANHVMTVATFWLNLNQNTPIYDDSLVHRRWLTLPPETTPEQDEANDTIPSAIASALPDPNNPTSIDLQSLLTSWLPNIVRYNATPYDNLPAYESTWLDSIAYIPIRYLTGADLVESYKTFAYTSWDNIQVTVTLRARQNTQATYIEQLRGPWDITRDIDNGIVGFDRGNLASSATIDNSIGNGFQFVVDNISLTAGQTVRFSYPVRYRPTQTVHIQVRDTNNDSRQDITTSPIDACQATSYNYISNGWRTYTRQTITQDSVASGIAQTQSYVNNALAGINSAVKSGDINQIPGITDALETRDHSRTVAGNLASGAPQANFNLNVDLDQALWIDTREVEWKIDTLLQWACKWFSVWWWGGKWPPVPFNMAFLAPGDINIMWCKMGTFKWLPIFAFPTNGVIPVWPPNPSWAGWIFGWTTSQIRLYITPTLTMSMWMAICFGPSSVWLQLPNPLRHIAGNCIVIAKKAWMGWWGAWGGGWAWWQDQITNTARAWNAQQQSCRNPLPTPGRPISPLWFTVYAWGQNRNITPGPSQGSSNIGPQAGTYLWVIDIDSEPYATQLWQQSVDKENLVGGKAITLKIEWGNVKWLIQCVMKKWMDNQIRYVINNLTNMSINISLPDISQLAQGFKNINLSESVQGFKDEFGKKNNSSSPAGQVLKNLVTKTKWENNIWTSQADVSDLGSTINNPFDALSTWFEQVPLIKVHTKNVTVQVPFVYNEELTKYTAQLQSLGKQSEKSIAERQWVIDDLAGRCEKQESASSRQACNKQVAYYINVRDSVSQLQRSIKENLQTLQAYKRFPLELQKWLTVSQRYMTEISSTVEWISTDLTSWLNTNATRFSSYVDTIIALMGAVKSRQALIDFSTDWKSKCGKCTVDNYDYYSCTLWIPCPRLPILAIPPFRLPNVYVDLSHIRLGLDVVLPKIQFVPRALPFPALPSLPTPPTISADLNIWYTTKIPSLPQLPAPPSLPELPSFIPSIDINLPTLPPAPKVPRIAPAITATLKVVGTISKVLCIVKNWIGLVWEKWVRTRIEQLTQRTWSVNPFDSLSITSIQQPLRGFDLKVDSYVNFELNFEWLYNVLDDLTQKINKKTSTIMSSLQQWADGISQASSDFSQWLQQWVDAGNIQVQGSLGIDGFKSSYNQPEMVDPSVLQKDIYKEIAALKWSEFAEEYKDQLTSIDNILSTPSTVWVNTEGIQEATNILKGMFAQTNASFESHKKSLGSYNSFLDWISNTNLISEQSTEANITSSLYTPSSRLTALLKKSEHPMKSYFNLQEKITNGFINALEKHDPSELNMGIFAYNKLLNYFRTTQQDIQLGKGIIEPKQETIAPSMSSSIQSIQKIIAPTVRADTANIAPIPSQKLWAIWRDEHRIYTNQSTYISKKNDGTRFSRYYEFEPIKSYNDIGAKVDENGYITLFNSAFNVWNQQIAITSLVSEWQSNKNITIHWKNSWYPVYLIMLTKNINGNHDQYRDSTTQRKYIIAYASWASKNINETFLSLQGRPTKKVLELQPEVVQQTIPFDPTLDEVNLTLPLDWATWSYVSIVQATLTDRGWAQTIRPLSAWSAQETLGVQRRGDTTPPQGIGRVIDRTNGNVVAEWTSLSVPRNGSYDFVMQWADDGITIENTLQEKGGNITTYSDDQAKVENLNTSKTIIYYGTARDQSENIWSQSITITFADPSIRIDSITKQTDQSEVQTMLSQQYSNWYVRFFNQRDASPYLLTGVTQWVPRTDFATTPSVWVTGWVFYDADTISLFTSQKTRIARIEKKTGKITVESERKDRLSLRLDSTQNTPSILFIDNKTQITLFSLYLKAQNLVNSSGLGNWFSLVSNDASVLWTFAGGQCLQDANRVCVLYITTLGDLYAPDATKARISGTYNYNGWVEYTITVDSKNAARILFIPQPIAQ